MIINYKNYNNYLTINGHVIKIKKMQSSLNNFNSTTKLKYNKLALKHIHIKFYISHINRNE